MTTKASSPTPQPGTPEPTSDPQPGGAEPTADPVKPTEGGTPSAPQSLWDQLPEELRAKPHFERFRKPESSIVDLALDLDAKSSMVGKMAQGDWVQIPEGPDTEGRRSVLAKLGVNEDFSTYAEAAKFDPNAMPEGFDKESFDPEFDAEFLKVAHAAGILPSEVNKLRGWVAERSAAAREAAREQHQAAIDKNYEVLEGAWGDADGRPFKNNVAKASEAADRLTYLAYGLDPSSGAELPKGAKTLTQTLNDAGLSTDPVVLRALAALQPVLSPGMGPVTSAGGADTLTPEDLISKAAALQNESFEFMHSNPDKTKQMQQEAFKLRQRAAKLRGGA